ncbi:hypothetical protein D3C84_974150 [compost metagenome]
MRGFGQAHQCRGGCADSGTGVGTDAVAGFLAKDIQHALGNTQADSRKTAGEIRPIRGEENLAVRIQTKACRLAFDHVPGFLNSVLRHESILDDQGFATAATHTNGKPVITNFVVTAWQHRKTIIPSAFGILTKEPHDGPFGMITA